MKLTPTRHAPLSVGCLAPGLWRFFDTTDGPGHESVVGPFYCTKMEALADLERYWYSNWSTADNREE